MEAKKMPGCCVGYVVYELDSEYYRQHNYKESIAPTPKKDIEVNLKSQLDSFKCSFVMATTNSNQNSAEEVLAEHGFKRIDSVPSVNHDDLMVTIWYKNMLTLD